MNRDEYGPRLAGARNGEGAEKAHSRGISMLCSIMVQTGRATQVKAGPALEVSGRRWAVAGPEGWLNKAEILPAVPLLPFKGPAEKTLMGYELRCACHQFPEALGSQLPQGYPSQGPGPDKG